MKNKLFFVAIGLLLFGCKKEEFSNSQIPHGIYVGNFQRELTWSQSDTSNIILAFFDNNWSGSSDIEKYPALCHGTYSVFGDTIVFNNDCRWTAEFDWTLILSGKYHLKRTGNTIEFSREYRSETNDTAFDKYKLVRQN